MTITTNEKDKIKVGLVQINNGVGNQHYLPLATGYLQSYANEYAENSKDLEFLPHLYKRIPIAEGAAQLKGVDVVGFSTYVWNSEISNRLAERVKEENPDSLIVFGGCHVPERTIEQFLRERPYIDIAVTGEGEGAFTKILENYPYREFPNVPKNQNDLVNYLSENIFHELNDRLKEKNINSTLGWVEKRRWGDISAANYLNKEGEFQSMPLTKRILDLEEIPSPYLTGVFDRLMNENDEQWQVLIETNRGCVFKCSFCDWGEASKSGKASFGGERLSNEIDWISENEIGFVYCCDANFGMYKEKDMAVALKMAANKKQHGYPQAFSVQNTKNSTDSSYEIQKILVDAKLDKGVLIAFQSLNPDTLEAIARDNISIDKFKDLGKRLTADGVTIFSDMILGLPEETYESFTSGISTLIESGQHNKMLINNFSVLPNAPAGDPAYQEKYGLELVESDILNIHGKIMEPIDGIREKQEMIIGTNTLSREEWVEARAYASTAHFLHFDKVMQIPAVIANTQYGIGYKDFFEGFMQVDSPEFPIISSINERFRNQALNMQNGGDEYHHSEKWLGIGWPVDEFTLIDLMSSGKMDEFYNESGNILKNILNERGIENHEGIIDDAVKLNSSLLKRPFQKEDLEITLGHNLFEVYQSALVSENAEIKEGEIKYKVDRTSNVWNSWEQWCEEVILWQNKKGAYIYDCYPAEELAMVK